MVYFILKQDNIYYSYIYYIIVINRKITKINFLAIQTYEL